jgi:hypothetical protein
VQASDIEAWNRIVAHAHPAPFSLWRRKNMAKSRHIALGATTAGCACIGAAVIVSIVGHSPTRDRGGSDLSAILFWSLPLGLLVAVVYSGWLRVARVDHLLAPVGLILLGPGVGFAWAFVVRAVLGGWYYAFGANVLLLWCGSATVGLIAGWWVHRIASLSDA